MERSRAPRRQLVFDLETWYDGRGLSDLGPPIWYRHLQEQIEDLVRAAVLAEDAPDSESDLWDASYDWESAASCHASAFKTKDIAVAAGWSMAAEDLEDEAAEREAGAGYEYEGEDLEVPRLLPDVTPLPPPVPVPKGLPPLPDNYAFRDVIRWYGSAARRGEGTGERPAQSKRRS